jgi:hypothetical protein
VADGGDAGSMLQFWLERGGDKTKYCQKMKQIQQTHFGYMRKKCDMAQQCGDIDATVLFCAGA